MSEISGVRRAAELLYDSQVAMRDVERELGKLGVGGVGGQAGQLDASAADGKPVQESAFSELLFQQLEHGAGYVPPKAVE